MKVRDVIKLIEAAGWRMVRARGSHRHYRHPSKLGIVTIAGHPSENLDAPTATGYSAHVPDLPGRIGAAATLEETRRLMKEAIEGHLECMREFGYAIPKPTTLAEEVEIPV